ncbi:MAG: hypothetical protein ACE5IZ_02690 [Dehalococcoidia bacterium]
MIELTPRAAAALLGSLKASGVGPDRGLRLTAKGGQLTLDLDSPADGDRIIRHGEEMVLIVHRDMEALVEDAVIDISETPDGVDLTIHPTARE